MRAALIQAYYRRQGIDALGTWSRYEQRQWDPVPQFRAHCEGLFLQTLEYARRGCSYYREFGAGSRPESFPVLGKREITDHFSDLTVREQFNSGCFMGSTSGTTGSRVEVWVDRIEREHRLGAAWRGDGFPAVPGGPAFKPWDPAAMLWGQTRVVKGWWQVLSGPAYERLFQRRIIDCFHLDAATMEANYRRVARLRPPRLIGYVAALADIARRGVEQGWAPLRFAKIVPTAEQLDEQSAALIARLFEGPQRQRYGCREAGDIAAQCEYGAWHVNSDFVYPEVLLPDGSIAREGTGTLLLTKLHNRVMPLVRYDIEDTVTLGGPPCHCGRALPVLASFDGRRIDRLLSADGTLINGLAVARVLRGVPYYEFQAVQGRAGECVLCVVPQPAFSAEHPAAIATRWRQFIGPGVAYRLELVDSIPRTAAGKRRQVVSQVGSGWSPPAEAVARE